MAMDEVDFDWPDVWGLMSDEDREQALQAFAHGLLHGPEKVTPGFLGELARRLHFRKQTLKAMPNEQLARMIGKAMPGILTPQDWAFLFVQYYFRYKTSLMCRFLDLCGISHDDQGAVIGEVTAPADMDVVAEAMLAEFGAMAVLQYFMVLLLHSGENWGFVRPQIPVVRAMLEEVSVVMPEATAEPVESSPIDQELADEFTQLDRVLIEQVISTVAGEERALFPEELRDLVMTVHALDTRRNRTYFHLGFMNALLGDAEEGMKGPEMNDSRREWYLAGLLAGFARQRDMDQIDHFLQQCQGDFERAARTPGGAGASMAKTIFPRLLESGRLSPSLVLLKGQVKVAGQGMLIQALFHASELLRRGEPAEAKAILTILHDQLSSRDGLRGVEAGGELERAVRRKLGQVYQAVGELDRARHLFDALLTSESSATAKLLADMGLVESGFTGLQEVRIEGDLERRKVLMAALEQGRGKFEEAVTRFPDTAHHAHYVLAVHDYLRFMDGDQNIKEDEDLAKSARQHAEAALSGMIGSDESEAFDRLGIVGRCRFILAVLRMAALDQTQAMPAMQAWRAIPAEAGQFPTDHLKRFLEWADVSDEETAIQIAESIWQARGAESLDLLRQQSWVVRSEKLREAFWSAAHDVNRRRGERFELLSFLVPALLRGYFQEKAVEGLDAMECLAEEDSALAGRFADWLQDASHYDPAWSEAEALRARYRCDSRCGKNVEAVATLRNLFHAVKNENPGEARQIRDMVREYEGDDGIVDLVMPPGCEVLAEKETLETGRQLEGGERVKVLFIGGNEIQARYDAQVRESIQKEWPGVEVQFEHTGWSSNWGAMVERLKRLSCESDAVVLMSMMRTMLGRTMRAALNDPPRPWVACTGTGKQAVENSVREAARVGLERRMAEVNR